MTSLSRRMFTNHLRPVICKTVAVAGLMAALAAPAFADDIADVNMLMRAGQYADALSKANVFLSKNPRDAQMRFLKGVILTEQNKSAEAIAVFARLTEDYPTLPEPYNNLAVLYAAAGQYDKARAALDSAIRTNPSYATAYENLGDVHAKLASQAYDKALQFDSGNSTAKSKLTLVRSLVGNSHGNTQGNGASHAGNNGGNTTKVAVAPAPVPTPVPPPAPVRTPDPVVTAPVKPAPAPVAKPAPSEQVAIAKPAAKAPAKPSTENVEREEIMDTVNDWAKAWSSQDVKSYLSAYSADFQTPNDQQRKAWEEERRSRIVGKGRINVKVEKPQVVVNGNTATVKFHQVYISDRLTANTRKTLVLNKQGGKWKIKQENTGS